MIKEKKEKTTGEDSLKKENQILQNQLAMMQDLQSLRSTAVYRQQKLVLLERQTLAMENLAKNSEIPSSEEEEEVEDEEE